MEWDFNTPWYRPTRVCHVTSGSECGWRNGAGKYPPYYPDNLPPVVDIGPGSPTGVCFGYGAKFPAKYQDAFFICDWSYGKLYAVHLEPTGAATRATLEEFVTGTPLPLTDVIVNPTDGAMYFAIGGRQDAVGAVPGDVRRRRIDRPGYTAGAKPSAEAATPPRAGGVPRQAGPEGGRGGVAAPGQPGPVHPLRRPDRSGTPAGRAVDGQGAGREGPAGGDHRAARPGPQDGEGPAARQRTGAVASPAGPEAGGGDPQRSEPHPRGPAHRRAEAGTGPGVSGVLRPLRQAGRVGRPDARRRRPGSPGRTRPEAATSTPRSASSSSSWTTRRSWRRR